MFAKVLIANRGEIACRIIATLRQLGVASVAVYSDADARARHVRLADEAIRIGGPAPAESYLNQPALIQAAARSGAQAIHPGYGFLAENADFARLCADAGIVFIGPTPDAIIAMGSKSESKRIMAAAGVPVVPGFFDAKADDQRLREAALALGFPLMIKATAGGGGKGMRLVETEAGFAEALAAARREAKGAFGNDEVLLEKFVDAPRHIEFQVFGDQWGGALHLFERECSLQRRYQKIIEESPSPFLDEKLRERMGQAAVAVVRTLGYQGAGTVEFIVGADREFYFLEMNTRLQVEHPVTELTTGLDLVEWQLRIAAGEPLPLLQEQVQPKGHAMEARLYAEDPGQGFLPSTGRLLRLALPVGDNIRIDSGVDQGDEVGIFYDPMLAKLIVYGADREHARSRMLGLLRESAVFGLTTNLHFLQSLVQHPAFVAAQVDTRFIDRNLQEMIDEQVAPPEAALLAAADRWLRDERLERQAGAGEDLHSPWLRNDGWRPGGLNPRTLEFADHKGDAHRVRFYCQGAGRYAVEGETGLCEYRLQSTGHQQSVEADGHETAWNVWRWERQFQVVGDGHRWHLELIDPLAVESADEQQEGLLTAPMPGKVIRVDAVAGQAVARGDLLLIVEAMKMEHRITAPDDGVVDEVFAGLNDFVEAGATLVSFRDAQE